MPSNRSNRADSVGGSLPSISDGRISTEKFAKDLLGESEIETILQELDLWKTCVSTSGLETTDTWFFPLAAADSGNIILICMAFWRQLQLFTHSPNVLLISWMTEELIYQSFTKSIGCIRRDQPWWCAFLQCWNNTHFLFSGRHPTYATVFSLTFMSTMTNMHSSFSTSYTAQVDLQ